MVLVHLTSVIAYTVVFLSPSLTSTSAFLCCCSFVSFDHDGCSVEMDKSKSSFENSKSIQVKSIVLFPEKNLSNQFH